LTKNVGFWEVLQLGMHGLPTRRAYLPDGSDCFRMLAHRAFCASAILRREAADMIRVGRLDSWTAPVPFKDSIPEII
jgi:hypothetical protein